MHAIPILIIIAYIAGGVYFTYDTFKGSKDGRNKRR
jgi:hypothetical protein